MCGRGTKTESPPMWFKRHLDKVLVRTLMFDQLASLRCNELNKKGILVQFKCIFYAESNGASRLTYP